MDREDQYLETRVLTATPAQLHLIVVDGALRNARHALAVLERAVPEHGGLERGTLHRNDLETAHLALQRARGFVAELTAGLDPQRTPDLVENLAALFAFVYQNLVLADLERSPARVCDALRVLELHRETWLTLLGTTPTSAPASAVPSPHLGLDCST